MTKVLRTIGKVSYTNLQDPEIEVMSGICDKIGKRRKKAAQLQLRGLERTLPICRHGSQYPPGCTVLECRFEADRPVARIVQVPTDTAAAARNSCLLVEMKPSSDSFSRAASRRKDTKQRIIDICSQTRATDKFSLLPASYIPKSHDRTDDFAALTGKVKVPIKIVSSVILETDKHKKQLDDFQILRYSSSKDILRASYCDDKLPKKPKTFVECITTPRGPLARVTQCPTKTKESDTIKYCIHLESKLKKDSSRKIIQPATDAAKRMMPGKKARVSRERVLSERSVSCRKSKPEVTRRSPLDYELARLGRADMKIDILFFPEMRDPLSQVTRKDGLDLSEIPSPSKKPSRRYKRICSASYQPIEPAAKDVSSDFRCTKSPALDVKPIEMCTTQKRPDDQRLQRLASERILRTEVTRIESAKPDEVSCQKSAAAFRRARATPEKIPGDTLHLPSSQELLARYKGYIPIHQLEKYEACRTKRNGLQDECIPPLLRTILEKEAQQRTLDKCKRERNVDRLDQSGTSESMCIVIHN